MCELHAKCVKLGRSLYCECGVVQYLAKSCKMGSFLIFLEKNNLVIEFDRYM